MSHPHNIHELCLGWCMVELVSGPKQEFTDSVSISPVLKGSPRMLLFLEHGADSNLKRKVAMENVFMESFIGNCFPRFQILSLLLRENELCTYYNHRPSLLEDIQAVIPGLKANCITQNLELLKLSKICMRDVSVSMDYSLSQILSSLNPSLLSTGKVEKVELAATLNVHNGHKMLIFKMDKELQLTNKGSIWTSCGEAKIMAIPGSFSALIFRVKATIQNNGQVQEICLGWYPIVPFGDVNYNCKK
eukprot:767395-Hanusia_phi.AAC.1